MCMYIHLMSQIVSLSNDVYNILTKMKGKNSYSEVIRKLIEKKTNKEQILEFFGKKEVNAQRIKEVDHLWKKWSEKYV